MNTCPDQHIRDRALDPKQSFIVQAPAGSGKTELLVRRFLVLLAHGVHAPEEIIAITFTRKAAAEMRVRILDALQLALGPAPQAAHHYQTWEIAQAALAKDRQYHWNLLDNPQRLKVQTIDAFCAHLTRRMPLYSGLGTSVTIAEDSNACYLQAVRRLFLALEEDSVQSDALSLLLLHVDNRVELLENLFVAMLMRRDQWLPHLIAHRQIVSPAEFRKILERSLSNVVTEILAHCQQCIPINYRAELLELFNFATANLRSAKAKTPMAQCGELQEWPSAVPELLFIWQALAEFLLTQKQEWRASVDVRIGFPPEFKQMKARMTALLQELRGHEQLLTALQQVRACPPPAYTTAQWEVLAAIAELLPLLVAQLNLLFREQNTADFSEIAMGALRALEEFDSPTELALILDQQIRHILVDEFQDTANSQFHLLEKLTAGWQAGDDRTLFLVGDPMQSIYRFREAEVGLFLRAQQEGVGSIKLEALRLHTNFRSTAAVVDWINTHFQYLFPSRININLGAVPYEPSVAIQTQAIDSGVYLYPFIDPTSEALSNRIPSIIQQLHQENSEQSIAILVRSRSHLRQIIPNLNRAGLRFNAVEIEALAQQTIIYDLFTLTSALMHLGDRLAWLAVLRAPWCGLTLADLYAVVGNDHNAAVWDLLAKVAENSAISADGKKRVLRIIPIFAQGLRQRARLSLRSWIEKIWQALRGPACVTDPAALTSAETFFELLEEFDRDGVFPDVDLLEQKLMRGYVSSKQDEQCRLHVMTIHKSKGLEFDAVIIPHLEKKSSSDDEQLLLWLERPQTAQENDLILAPIKSRKIEVDPIYQYLRQVEKSKGLYEMTRLLYVAATRAKNSLHLLAEVKMKEGKLSSADKNSLLSLLWQPFSREVEKQLPLVAISVSNSNQELRAGITLKRLDLIDGHEDQLPSPEMSTSEEAPIARRFAELSLNNMNTDVGSVVHRCLQEIAQQGIEHWQPEKIQAQSARWRIYLLQAGVIPQHLNAAMSAIETAITRTLLDPRSQWLLKKYAEQGNEYAITALVNGRIASLVIDRTFIDENNTRWIVDYKTTDLQNENIETFLDRAQQQHRQQLENYAQAMRQIDKRPIRLGLYFPLFAGWREWVYNDVDINAGASIIEI